MKPIIRDPRALFFHGDALEIDRILPPNSVDALVEDPPYGLGFMGKEWDHDVPGVPFWQAAMRVMKPGAHGLVFGGTRKYHRQVCAIEDAGFEIRDCLMYLYGSGFPKSLNVSKAIDAKLGTEPLVLGTRAGTGTTSFGGDENGKGLGPEVPIVLAGSPEAAAWDGWGTALKPAWEPIILFRKPLEGTVAENVLRYGTGGLNIDGCRIASGARPLREHTGRDGNVYGAGLEGSRAVGETEQGRWPANLILDELAALVLDEQSGTLKSGARRGKTAPNASMFGVGAGGPCEGSEGGASRFFYTAKAARKERDRGLEHLPPRSGGEATDREDGSEGLENPRAGAGRGGGARNFHPTVKPVSLMRYLVRLLTPPGGVVMDRFGGSGTTAVAALEEGLSVITVEKTDDYLPIIEGRIRAALARTAAGVRSEE